MFLALQEMRKEKLRYGLVIAVIALISFLIFILSALALGLSHENTAAVSTWRVKSVAMSNDADGNLAQSLLSKAQVTQLAEQQTHDSAPVGVAQAIVKYNNQRVAATYVGWLPQDRYWQRLTLTAGHRPKTAQEVVVSNKLQQSGLKIGDQLTIGLLAQKLTVVGLVTNAAYNMAPVVYGDLQHWSAIKGLANSYYASGLMADNQIASVQGIRVVTPQQLFNHMPGYSAQNKTFEFMIAFLVVISIVVVAIFLYILTMQKLPNFAVLRTQGIPSRYLVLNTLSETAIIMALAVAIGLAGCFLSSLVIPSVVPMYFDMTLIMGVGLGLIAAGMLAAFIPIRLIIKIEPQQGIGG